MTHDICTAGGVYQLVDLRAASGELRVVATFTDPAEARAALDALRAAGAASADVSIVPTVDPLADA